MKDKEYSYRFTVFTPCYNSADFIHRVITSLEKQRYTNFEWLVLEDCSKDGTFELLEAYQKKAPFPMRLYQNEVNQGLTANYGEAIRLANGELFVPLGHDDEMLPDALEYLDDVWRRKGSSQHSGIWSNCVDQDGVNQGIKFPEEEFSSNLFKIFMSHLWRKEYFPCIRTKLMRKYPLIVPGLRYVPEGILWFRIAKDYDTLFVDQVTRIYYKDSVNALTKRGREKISSGVVYQNTIWINELMANLAGAYEFKLRIFFGLCLYGILDGKKLAQIKTPIKKLSHRIILTLLYPLAMLFQMRQKG